MRPVWECSGVVELVEAVVKAGLSSKITRDISACDEMIADNCLNFLLFDIVELISCI